MSLSFEAFRELFRPVEGAIPAAEPAAAAVVAAAAEKVKYAKRKG